MRTLRPPRELDDDIFVVVWDRDADTYVLSLKDGRSYTLGDGFDAFFYFKHVLNLPVIGQKAMDCARNFYTAIAVISENRVFSAETEEAQTGYSRFFKTESEELLVV